MTRISLALDLRMQLLLLLAVLTLCRCVADVAQRLNKVRYDRIVPQVDKPLSSHLRIHWTREEETRTCDKIQGTQLEQQSDTTVIESVADVRSRRLQSAEARACVVRRSLSRFGDGALAAAGPRLLISLPAAFRQSDVTF